MSLGVVSAVFDWDWPSAARAFQRAIAINPRHPTARQWYAMNYLAPQRQFAEAIRQVGRAQSLDPLSLAIRASAGALHHLAGNVVEAAAIEKHVVDTDNEFALGHYFLGASYRDMGALDRAIASFERAIELAGPSPEILAACAIAHIRRGDAADAARLTDQLEAMRAQRYVAPSLFAQIAAARGDTDGAMAWLERATEARDADLIFLALRPAYETLLRHPRFEPLRLRIGLA